MKNLILGAATGYQADQIMLFINSLSRVDYHGDLGLIGLQIPEEIAKKAPYETINISPSISTIDLPSWARNKGRARIFQKSLYLLSRSIGRASRQARISFALKINSQLLHIACSRYHIYLNFLKTTKQRYDRVLLCDVRDLFFQSDPFKKGFRSDLGNLTVFSEDSSTTFDSEPINKHWYKSVYSPEDFERIKNHAIICSGTTYGTRQGIIDYLSKMVLEMDDHLTSIVGELGVDQSIHNHLIHNNCLDSVYIAENGTDRVLTMKTMPSDVIYATPSGEIVTNDGQEIPTLHQWDFHKPQAHATPAYKESVK